MTYRGLVLILGVALLSGCQQGADEQALRDKAGVEGEAAAQKQITAENENLALRANRSESELSRRHDFYESVKGVYEGVIRTEQGNFNIRVTLIPNLPRYTDTRVRSLSEIEYDLTNLSFNAQVVQWLPGNALSAVGCRAQNIRPDFNTTEIAIASSECPNLYRFTAQGGSIEGEVQPSTNASIYSFTAARVKR